MAGFRPRVFVRIDAHFRHEVTIYLASIDRAWSIPMAEPTKNTSDVIVVGCGVAGASTAMQLAQRGLRVIVIDRGMLGSGSTGRAAGLLGQLRSTRAATKMLIDGLAIVRDLERTTETEIFVQTGSLRLATDEARTAEIRDHVAMGESIGFAIHRLDRQQVAELLPYMKCDDLVDSCYCPTDGHLQPAELLAAYVRVARETGADFHANTPMESLLSDKGQVAGVRAGGKEFFAPVVVNASGPWSYLTADRCETRLATAAIGHCYLTTQPRDDVPVDRHSPAVRDRGNRIYSRPEAGGLIVGCYEAEPPVYDMAALGDDFDMSQMRAARNDIHVATLIDAVGRRFPFIDERSPMTITVGIMTFTPDGRPFCGRTPDIEGLYHCSGFCGHGIVQSPTIGKIMAELIVDGRSSYDISEIEADRLFEEAEFRDRSVVEQRCHATASGYYGAVAMTDGPK